MRARRYHPESPTPYLLLGGLYANIDEYDEAMAQFTGLLEQFPDNPSALNGLIRISIYRKDFEAAEQFAQRLKDAHSDDPYTMEEYYDHMSNLANWQGHFKKALDYRFDRLGQVMKTGDSLYITQVYRQISNLYEHVGMLDSATYYSHRSYEWAPPLMRLNHPLTLVTIDPDNADTARPLFDYALMDFKARLPEQIWPLVFAIQEAFEAHVARDTAAIADAMQHIYENTPGGGSGNHIDAGIYAIRAGQYERGRDILARYVGDQMSTSALRNFNLQYYLGIAEEGLGNQNKAAAHYREMLRYWGNPDIEIKEIMDARQRLARLTS
jgi:predicted Zn-dependent protease